MGANNHGGGRGSVIRRYAQILGIGFLVVGSVGLRSSGDELGLLNGDYAEDAFHILTGIALVYAGFFATAVRRDAVVVVQGVVYLLIGVYAIVDPGVFGLMPHELGLIDNALHLVEGVLSIGLVMLFGVRSSVRRAAAVPPA